MDIYLLNYLLSATISIPLAIGLWKWKHIDKSNRPIIVAFVGIFLNETLRFILIKTGPGQRSMATYNIFVLVLMWLYTWQFEAWRIISRRWMYLLGGLLSILWFLDYFVFAGRQVDYWRYWFRLTFALEVVVLSVNCINSLIVSEKTKLISNHKFLICLGFVLYYTYRVFNDAFALRGFSREFLTVMGDLNRYLVQVYYAILIIAALCIPRKKNFLRLS